MMYDYLIVGCGFAGATLAERIANELGKSVLIVDRRNHVGGNAYDFTDRNGIRVGKYGAHIFHTNSAKIWNYVARFAEFNGYVHTVDAFIDGQLYPLPLNLQTINKFFGTDLTEQTVEAFLKSKSLKIKNPKTAEEMVLSKVGRELYEAFYQNYTIKQWGLHPRELDASVTARLPIRFNEDCRYFTDRWQGIPREGYENLFRNLLNFPGIEVLLNTSFRLVESAVQFDKLIFTGPIDEFFDYGFGKLPYRSLSFEFERFEREYFQHKAVVNYPNEQFFTRIVEYKYFYQQKSPYTTISKEYPCWNDQEPYYPVPNPANREVYGRYRKMADKLKSVYFCGRLATYKYLNMDQCIGQALSLFEKQISRQEKARLAV